ncbi:MAG: amidohydrolase [Pseudoflavonifractor sp.]
MKKLYYNGNLITLEPGPAPEALLSDGGSIAALGSLADLRRLAPHAEPVDLGGKTLLPAFIDAHGHFSSYANATLQVALEGCADFAEIAARLAAFRAETGLPPGAWVVANGYDHNALAEHAHPDLAFLNHSMPENPLIMQHQSGHCGVLNSAALAALGITPETPAPAGGIIGLADGALTGYLEESAYINAIKAVPMADLSAMLGAYRRAQSRYFARGISTVQEGMMVAQMLPLYEALIAAGLLKLDLVGYADMSSMAALRAALPGSVGQYRRQFKIGGYKIILDGSPQVKTAWMKTPYAGSTDCGYPSLTDAQVLGAVQTAAAEGTQILAHCNGDAAIDQFLSAVEQTPAATRLRPVIIHAQLMTLPQLQRAAALHVIPSFFVAHVLHWGDIHAENFGPARAQTISPARSALDCGLPFTFHQDAPVIEPDMMETIQCAVCRRTKAGLLLGADQRISVLDALRAVTINAAHQYFEEDSKGSLKAGKHADFVILERNPLRVPPEELSKIAITETIKDGETVFCNN